MLFPLPYIVFIPVLIGFGSSSMKINKFVLDPECITIGDDLRFSFEPHLKEKSKVRLEYAVFFVKANGHLSKKIFKISEGSYEPGTHSFVRKHCFADMSTRKHYPGTHHISLIVNVEEAAKASFVVKK